MKKISLRILLTLLIGSSISACKPSAPIPTTNITKPPAALNTPPSMAKTSTPSMTLMPIPTPTLFPSPTPVLSLVSMSSYPGWTTYPDIQSIKHLLFDQVGNLWAVGPQGVFVIKPDGTLQHFTMADGLPSNDLLSVGEGTDNSVWVGSNGSGISRFDGKGWKTFTTADGLGGNVVRDIVRYMGARGILVATDHGASWYDDQKWQNYAGPSNLPNDEVTSILSPRWDTVWVGTLKGLRLFETTQTYTTSNGLVNDEVNAMGISPDCSLWAGTIGGASHLSEGSWTSYTTTNGLADNWVSSIAVSLDGTAWFGTPAGVSRFDGKTWTTLTTQDGLADNHVLSVMEAPNETLWLGTAGGLSHYSPSLTSQAAETGQTLQGTEAIYTGPPLIYIKGGDLWTWSAGEKKQATSYGNISGFFLSADRSKVAVFRRGDNDETSLWVMNLDGSQARLLVSQDDLDALGKFSETKESLQTNSRVSFRGTAWVPGTYTIAYGTYRHIKYDGTIFHDDLNLVDTVTGEKTTLLPPGSGGGFTYSPDGSQIAIIGQNQISIMNADGSHRRDEVLEYPTIQDVDNYYYPTPIWSADAQYLILALPPQQLMSDSRSPTTLWKIPADGTPAIQLGTFEAVAFLSGYTAFSPDLTRLAYLDEVDPSKGTLVIHIANYDGSGDKVIQEGKGVYFVNWSPDGQHFVYYKSSNDTEAWYISDLNGISTPLAYKPEFLNWVSKDAFLQYDSLPCARFEMRLTPIDGESQVIDRFWYD